MKNVLLAVCCLAIAASSAWAQTGRGFDDRPKISVSGEATVYATPDRIVVQLGVETQDKNILVAKQKSNDIVKKVFAALKLCGVKDRDIQTQYLYAEPRWEVLSKGKNAQTSQRMSRSPAPQYASSEGGAEEPRRFLGYFVKNVIAVTVKDAAKIDKLIADVLAAGATHIYGVEFQTSDLKTYREKARELALKAAKEKAVKMAAVLGQSVGAPIEIGEADGRFYNSDSNNSQVMGFAAASTGGTATTIALGKVAISATVNVTFELKR